MSLALFVFLSVSLSVSLPVSLSVSESVSISLFRDHHGYDMYMDIETIEAHRVEYLFNVYLFRFEASI